VEQVHEIQQETGGEMPNTKRRTQGEKMDKTAGDDAELVLPAKLPAPAHMLGHLLFPTQSPEQQRKRLRQLCLATLILGAIVVSSIAVTCLAVTLCQ
jgi:hypothetical protein